MTNKVSVITVVLNDVKHIRETMESFFSQTWTEKEYIVIDGGSTDGTVEIIREYADRLAFWCSEPDGGIYDAMNKGINHCTGDWINMLNSGDTYVTKDSLLEIMNQPHIDGYDVVYGDSVQVTDAEKILITSGKDVTQMKIRPIYRHGSSIVAAETQKKHLFRLEKKNEFGFALDWDNIFNMYHEGCKFMRTNVRVENYLYEGVSQAPFKTLKYNYRITTQYGVKPSSVKYYCVNYIKQIMAKSGIYRIITTFFGEYIPNSVLAHIPFWRIRRAYFRTIGTHIGKGTVMMKDNTFLSPRSIVIGNFSHINKGCILDGRGGIEIGDSVSISYNVSMMTGSHDCQSPTFVGKYEKIVIEDYVWIGVGATILQGVTIGRGAVVCAGSVVTKNVEPYSIVGGVPARKIGERTRELNYKCVWDAPLS